MNDIQFQQLKKYEPFWGSWYLVREIGKGGFSHVYEIERNEFGTTYKAALKHIQIPQDRDEIDTMVSEGMSDKNITEYYQGYIQNVVSEFELMYKFKGNSYIVNYEDHMVVPNDDGVGANIFIRMELLSPLTAMIKDCTLSEDEVIRIGIDVCKALELCEKEKIVHRDLKPENIFYSSLGNYKIGDFGIARVLDKTQTVMTKKGTLGYMAPEVYKGDTSNKTVDIYSLGLILYRLCNRNRMPFIPTDTDGISFQDRENAMYRRMSGEQLPDPCEASDVLKKIILKACEYRPKDRYQSATKMLEDLLACKAAKTEYTQVKMEEQAVLIESNSADMKKEDTSIAEGDETVMLHNGNNIKSAVDEELDETHILEKEEMRQSIAVSDTTDRKAILKIIGKVLLALGGVVVAGFIFILIVGIINMNKYKMKIPDTTSSEQEEVVSSTVDTSAKNTDLDVSKKDTGVNEDIKVDADNEETSKQEIETAEKEENPYEIDKIYTLGHYEQDADTQNGEEPIEWMIIDVEDNKMLLLSLNILDYMQYHSEKVPIVWKDSSIRKWLNSTFLQTAFSEEEQEMILTTQVENDSNITEDKVFLLDGCEAGLWECFSDGRKYTGTVYKNRLMTSPTKYAVEKGAKPVNDYRWWLRSANGDVNQLGAWTAGFDFLYPNSYAGVRPLIWVDITKLAEAVDSEIRDHIYTEIDYAAMAEEYYKNKYGEYAPYVECEMWDDSVTIHIFDMVSRSDWYGIDTNTLKGDNTYEDEKIDLSPYIDAEFPSECTFGQGIVTDE